MTEPVTLNTLALYAVGSAAVYVSLQKVRARIELSLGKHRSLAGHSRMAKRVAPWLPG